MADRLGALGVLLDGLLLEQQLAAPADTPPPPPVAAPASAEPPASSPAPAPRRRTRKAPPPPSAPAPDPARIRPGGAPTEAPFDPGPAPPPEPPPLESVRVVVLPPPPPRVTITPQTRFFGGVELGLRWRTPALLVPQAGLIGGYGPLQAALTWQPSLAWAWDGRRYSQATGGLGVEALLPMRRSVGWRLALPVGAQVEYSRVQRTDVSSTSHGLVQLGLSAGLLAGVRLGEAFWLTPAARGRWLPLGSLRIEGGPAVPFNEAGVEVGLGLLLAPGW
ncbi:MAG: hypothetical protein R3F60_07815 [bacterium]